MKANRRDFLVNAGLAATAAAMGGCAAVLKTAPGGAMTGYAAPRLGKVRVGVVGIGSRGSYAVHRLCTVPGVEVAALCDLKAERAQEARQWMKERNFGEA